ncbi:reverse transcriptase [Caerostris darwini]|uniref:Reverse transcriptase n=1 Tax=Caerostris darwini TaxID=1538125 RepID=A0AAV4UDI0_9ARAC|nr:reverse transcriptase [Caerostris darwini]
MLAELIISGWALLLKWVPSHGGVPGNERVDVMAKRGAESNQPEFPITFKTICNHITATIDNFHSKSFKDFSGNKRWKCLAAEDCIPMYLECVEAIANFRLTTGL